MKNKQYESIVDQIKNQVMDHIIDKVTETFNDDFAKQFSTVHLKSESETGKVTINKTVQIPVNIECTKEDNDVIIRLNTNSDVNKEILIGQLHGTTGESLNSDIPKKIKDESLSQEDIITKRLYKDYSLFKRELFQNLTELNPDINQLELFKKSQKLIDRFIYINEELKKNSKSKLNIVP